MTAPANPLLLPVLACLRRQPQGLTEYALLRQIKGELPALAAEAGLALFQKHFLVMNALYQLQRQLWEEEGLWLSISALDIRLERCGAGTRQRTLQAAGEDRLRDYYLDWSEFEGTGSDEVSALLAGFWRRFHDREGLDAAFAALGLEPGAGWPEVQAQYRRLARASHPDRGGSAGHFLEVRTAYERLRRSLAVGPAAYRDSSARA